MPPRKKSTQGDSSCKLWVIITILIVTSGSLLVLNSSTLMRSQSDPEQSLSLGGEESSSKYIQRYRQLVKRAKELSDQYKELTGESNLPEKLTFKATRSSLVGGMNSRPGSLDTDIPHPQQEPAPIGARSTTSDVDTKYHSNLKLDLVIGMAQNTDPKNLAVFCKSLRRHSKARVIVFANEPIPERHLAIAEETNTQLVGFKISDLQPPAPQNYHPSTLRWALFYEYFQEHSELQRQYGRVWMVDVRDSYFQGDPFSFLSPGSGGGDEAKETSEFHVFNGVESFPIKTCGWNSGWVKDCFGAATLARVGEQRIICSGVSAGTMDAVIPYLKMMRDIVTGRPATSADQSHASIAHKFPSCERNGVDQGIHNVLVHTGAIPFLRQWGQAESPVANMQARVATIRGSKVYNGKGQEVVVVHQYDRFPELQKALFEEFVDWVNTNDFKAEWSSEAACAPFSYRENVDMFKGMCDLKMHGGATSAASCCSFCRDTAHCRAFTYVPGQCFLKRCSVANARGQPMAGAISGYTSN